MPDDCFMTEQELDQQRRERWHLDGKPVTHARRGAQVYRVGRILPDVSHAPGGSGPHFHRRLGWLRQESPTRQHAFADPRAREATDIMVRLLRNHDAYEANQFDENNAFLVAPSIFPSFTRWWASVIRNRPPTQAALGVFAIGL